MEKKPLEVFTRQKWGGRIELVQVSAAAGHKNTMEPVETGLPKPEIWSVPLCRFGMCFDTVSLFQLYQYAVYDADALFSAWKSCTLIFVAYTIID